MPATSPALPTLGPLGSEVLIRLLAQRPDSLGNDDPLHALTGVLTAAYGALVGGDTDAARSALGDILAPALDLERALGTLQQATAEAHAAATALTGLAPAALTVDVACDGATLAAWHDALEASIAAQTEELARLAVVIQLQQRAFSSSQ